MTTLLSNSAAVTVRTRYAESRGRKLAYRQLGNGPSLVLCLRFRGVMDSWDPAFLDALAEHFSVITFDYTGLGLSTGEPSYDRATMARDAEDLVDALGLEKVAIGGWSIGGIAAQIFAARNPERTTHAILIGTVPPGPQPHQAEPIFLQTALPFHNSLEDETILFFEPASASSRAAAVACHERIASRTEDTCPVIPEETYTRILMASHDADAVFPDHEGYAEKLANAPFPILSINGDHDIVFPVENWYALNRQWKNLHLLTYPEAGHGPQHQFPRHCAEAIASFIRNVR